MRGLILAGGKGTRLHPLTIATSKQLLPVYNKPLIYYPLSVLMLAGIREILIITNPEDLLSFERLLKDGNQWGLKISYAAQGKPRGIADALLVGEQFIAGHACGLILGDNIFYGAGLQKTLRQAASISEGAAVFAYPVKDPGRYGVIELDPDGKAISIEEKPEIPKSNFVVPGLYFYGGDAAGIARCLRPSARGEIEISDLNRFYLESGKLRVYPLGRGVAWLDAGTYESLLQAASFVQTVEDRQGMMISCPEEIAFFLGYISSGELLAQAERMVANGYGEYLLGLLKQHRA
jgi:glucose-1-phosphate thymidylyltransferase